MGDGWLPIESIPIEAAQNLGREPRQNLPCIDSAMTLKNLSMSKNARIPYLELFTDETGQS